MCVVAIWGLCLLLPTLFIEIEYPLNAELTNWQQCFSSEFLASVSLFTVLEVCIITLIFYMDAEFLYSNTLSILIPLASLAVKL